MATMFIERAAMSFVGVGAVLYAGHAALRYVVGEVAGDLQEHLNVHHKQLGSVKEQLQSLQQQNKLLEAQLHLAHHRMDDMQEQLNRAVSGSSGKRK